MRELLARLDELNRRYYSHGDDAIDVEEYAAEVSSITAQLYRFAPAECAAIEYGRSECAAHS